MKDYERCWMPLYTLQLTNTEVENPLFVKESRLPRGYVHPFSISMLSDESTLWK